MTSGLSADARPEQDGVRARRGPVLLALVLAMALAAMDTTIVATAVPQIVQSVGGFSIFSWLFSVYLLTQTVTIPVYGKLADVYGRKPVLLTGISLFLAGSALCAGAWDIVALIAFRALQGIGAGGIQATVQTVAGDLYSLRERGRVQGWLASMWGVSAVVGPAIGGLFADYASWRWIFIINLPVGAVALVIIVLFLRETGERGGRHRIDYLGGTLTLMVCGGLVFALLQGGNAWAWLSAPSLACFAAVAVLAVALIVVERRAAEPVVPGWVWRTRVLASSNIGCLALGMLVIGPSTFLPTYAQTVLGLDAIPAGLALATMIIGWTLTAGSSNRLYLRLGFRDTALTGTAVALLGAGGFVLAPPEAPIWAVVTTTAVLGAGLGLISTSLIVGVQSTVGTDRRGVATSSLMFCRFLGQSLGAAVFGTIVNATLRHELDTAPAALAGALPHDLDEVAPTIADGGASAAGYLRSAMDTAVQNVYIGLTVVAALAVVVMLLTPRRFPVLEQESRAFNRTGDGTSP